MMVPHNKKRLRQAILCLCCILLSTCLSGCWSQRELNKLAIVAGTALDVGDEGPGSIKMTAQMVKVGAMGAETAGAVEQAYVNVSATDQSVLGIVRDITHMQNRRLYFTHNKVLIYGSELAKQGVLQAMDVFVRDYEGRMNVYVLIAKDQAADILNEDAALEKVPSLQLYGMMENQKLNSETVVVTLRDYVIATLSSSTAPVAPMIEMVEEEGKKHARLQNTAVFKEGKMIGEMNKDQTKGLLWITNKVKGGVVNVDTQWGQVVLEILQTSGKLKPVKEEDGSFRMDLTVDINGIIQSNESTENMGTLENVNMLKDKMKESIRTNIAESMAQARSLKADVFGFGDAIRQNFPDEWEQIKEDWVPVFTEIELDVQLNVELRNTGGLTQPIVPGGAA